MRRGVGEGIDDLQLLDDRPGPPVRDYQRQRIFVFRSNVNEVNVQPIDLGDEVRQGIQPGLALVASMRLRNSVSSASGTSTAENHPLFQSCLPRDPRVSTVNMFGGVAAKVNGQMFAGLFARGAIVKLSEPDRRTALAIDGAAMFDPMGNGSVMRDTVLLPESVMEEPEELRAWLRKALDYTATLPAKTKSAKSGKSANLAKSARKPTAASTRRRT